MVRALTPIQAMRLALLVGSDYQKNGKLPQVPASLVDLDLVERRLSAADAGFQVVRFEAERGLAERLEQWLGAQTDLIEQVLIYFNGYCVLSAERGPALLLDGDRLGTFGLSRLRTLFEHFSSFSCLIVDALAVVDAEQTPQQVAQAIGQTVTEDAEGLTALVAVRDGQSAGSSLGMSFTELTLRTLDALSQERAPHQPVDVRWLFQGLRAEAELGSSGASADLYGEEGPSFVLLPGAPTSRDFGRDEPNTVPGAEAFADDFSDPVASPGASVLEADSNPYNGPDTDQRQLSMPPFGSAPEAAPRSTPFGDSGPISEAPDTSQKQPTLPPIGHPPEMAEPPLPSFEDENDTASGAALGEERSDALPAFAVEDDDAVVEPGEDLDPRGPLPSFDDVTPSDRLPSFASSPEASSSAPVRERLPSVSARDEGAALGRAFTLSSHDAFDPAPVSEGMVQLPAFPLEDVVQPPPPQAEGNESEEELLAAQRYFELTVRLEAALGTSAQPEERAGVLARLARVQALVARRDLAAQNFAEAVQLAPLQLDVLRVRAEWAEAAGDATDLLHTAEAWLAVVSRDRRALGYLARAAEKLHNYQRALTSYRKLARHAEASRAEKAGALRQALRIAELALQDERLGNRIAQELQTVLGGNALEELEETVPPPSAVVSESGTATPAGAEPAPSVDAPLEALAPSVPESPIHETTDVRPSAAAADATREAKALEEQLAVDPDDLEVRARLIEQYTVLSQHERALEQCRALARRRPLGVETYRHAQGLFEASGSRDGAWNAASVLECLGEADINESLLVSQHKPEGLLAARTTIPISDWPLAELSGGVLDPLLHELGEGAVPFGIALVKQTGSYAEPDPSTLQDPEKSTTMLAKTLAWTARLFGLKVPMLYLTAEESGLVVAPVEEPAVVASRTLGSGLGLGELAFLWGRRLPWLRPEWRLLSVLGQPKELSAFVSAVQALADDSDQPARALEGEAKRTYSALRRELRGDEAIARLRDALTGLNGELDALCERELQRLELMGVRMGLLACGDVAIAADLLRRFPQAGLTTLEDQLGELYAFAISREYTSLRERIGVAIAA